MTFDIKNKNCKKNLSWNKIIYTFNKLKNCLNICSPTILLSLLFLLFMVKL